MATHVHHRVPRCLTKAWDRGHGPGLEPEDLAAWFDWEEEAFRYGVYPDISRGELAALIEGSTVEIAGTSTARATAVPATSPGGAGSEACRRCGATAGRGSRCLQRGAGRRSAPRPSTATGRRSPRRRQGRLDGRPFDTGSRGR